MSDYGGGDDAYGDGYEYVHAFGASFLNAYSCMQ